MRMWMLDPKFLCRKHLLGEHGEIHKHLPSFRKGHKIDGRFNPIVQIEISSLEERHDSLANEMLRRGYNHKSPLKDIPDMAKIYPQHYDKKVDVVLSALDLSGRCEECRKNLENET